MVIDICMTIVHIDFFDILLKKALNFHRLIYLVRQIGR